MKRTLMRIVGPARVILGAVFIICFIINSLTTAHSAETRPFQKTFGEWITKCEIDRMTDKETCSVTSRVLGPDGSHRYVMMAQAQLPELELEFQIVGHGAIRVTSIACRVDKNPAAENPCGLIEDKLGGGAIYNACPLSVDADQIQKGNMMLIRAHFFDNTEYEHNLSMIDLRKAIEAMGGTAANIHGIEP